MFIFDREATALPPKAPAWQYLLNLLFTFNDGHLAIPQWGAFIFFISGNDAPQFMRITFLADNVSSFTVFPNKMPGALPCLQTLSHQANILLILFPISFTALRGFRNMFGELKEALSSQFSRSPSLISPPLLFLSQQASGRAFDWLFSTKGCTARSLGSQGQL